MTNRIRELRKQNGLNQQELAERIGTTGQQVGHLEAGRRKLTQSWMERLAQGLDCVPADRQPPSSPRDSYRGSSPSTATGLRLPPGAGALLRRIPAATTLLWAG